MMEVQQHFRAASNAIRAYDNILNTAIGTIAEF
jgi:hypothetical protein